MLFVVAQFIAKSTQHAPNQEINGMNALWHSPGPNALWHSPCGMLRLFELVDGNPRRVRTTFKRIFNIGIIYAHPLFSFKYFIL